MVTFVYAKQRIPPLFVVVMAFIMSSFGITQNATAQSLACNNKIQLSLGSNCYDTIQPSLFLTTPVAAADSAKYWIEVKNSSGVAIDSGTFRSVSDTLAIIKAVGTYTISVHFDADGVKTGTAFESNNSCWGILVVEFKQDLTDILNSCCGIGNDSCMYNYLYLDSIFMDTTFTGKLSLNPNFTGIQDSIPCLTIDVNNIMFRDELINDICNDLRIRRTWFTPNPAPNPHTNNFEIVLVQQEFLIKKNTLSRVMAPHKKVQIACGIDPDPQSIFDYLTSKTNPLSIDSALMCAFPFIVDTLLAKDTNNALVHFDTVQIALKPGVLSSTKTHVTGNLAVSFSDLSKIPFCGKGFKFVRNWNIIDWCTQYDTSFTQIIDATGAAGITMNMKTDTFTVSTDPWFCKANLIMDLPLVDAVCSDEFWITFKNDALGINLTFTSTDVTMNAPNLPPGKHEFIISIQDACNNMVTDTIFVKVIDGVSPVAVAKEQVVTTLLSFGGGVCAAKVRANSVDNNSYDACGEDVKLEVKRFNDHDSTYKGYVELNTNDLTGVDSRGISFGIVKVSLRVWDDGNGDGTPSTPGDNFNIAWTNIRIEDKKSDISAECGETLIEVNCDEKMNNLIKMHKPTAFKAGCVQEQVPVSGHVLADGREDRCGLRDVTVQYKAGGKIICTKIFWFMDMSMLDSTVFPKDNFSAKCTDQSFGELDLSGIDLNCKNIGTSLEEESFEFETGLSCIKILRHFTVIDWCEHDANKQTFFIKEKGVNVGYCTQTRTVPDTTIVNTFITVIDTIRNGIWKHTQLVKISDGTPPELTDCKDETFSADANCESVVVLTNTAIDNVANGVCPSGNLSWVVAAASNGDSTFDTPATVTGTNDVTATLPGKWSVGSYNVKWTVLDVCGNRAECFTKFHVVDDKAPVPICIRTLSTAVMAQGQSITIWATDFMASPANDSCSTTIEYSFSKRTPDEKFKTVRCADINDGISQIFELNIYAHDGGGNVGFCIAQIKVDDTADACQDTVTGNALVAGNLYTADGDDIESARVSLHITQRGENYNDLTDVKGEYAFENIPTNYDYRLTSEKNDDYLNGVSTLDLVLIQKHILGLEFLPSAYKVIAADVSSDERISAIDLVELRKVILGVSAEFQNNDSWRFVDATQTFDDALNPWPFTELMDIRSLDHNVTDMDFIGVKIGDVSGNVVPNSAIADSRSVNSKVVLSAEDQEIQAGEEFVLTMEAENILGVSGIQLGLEFNGAQLSELSSGLIELTADNYFATDGALNLSWVDARGTNLDGELLSLAFTATTDGLISEMVQFSHAFRSEIYTGSNDEVNDVQLAFKGASETVVGTVFELYQNEPNPFDETTSVSFFIGEDGGATLSVFDITGKLIYEVADEYTKGLNRVSIDKSELNASGVLYYQLHFQGYIATRKMITIN